MLSQWDQWGRTSQALHRRFMEEWKVELISFTLYDFNELAMH